MSEELNPNQNWSDLTTVLLTNIFKKLPLEYLFTILPFISKSWYEASKDPSLYSTFDLEPYFDKSGNGSGDSVKWWSDEFERKIDLMVRKVATLGGSGLKLVRVRHCSDWGLDFIAEKSPNVEILSIESSQHVTDATLGTISLACPNLRELDISKCYEISYKSLENIGKNCPNLAILKRNFMNWLDPSQHTGTVPDEYLCSCPQDGDREAFAIAQFMPKLNHLELRFSKLTASGLLKISERCQNLETLDLFGCANLTSRGIEQASANLKNLASLKKPNFYIPRSVFHTERYGHWRLYDERFQTNIFQI